MAEGFLTHPTKPAYGLALFFLTNIGLYIDLSYAETKNSNVTSAEDHGVCPKLYKGIPNVLVSVGDQIDFDIPEDAFTGNFSVIQLTANSDDEKLPRWLYYNTSSRLFEGRPEADDVGTLEIHIIVGCEDCLERCTNVSSAFSIVVQFERSTASTKPNRAPILVKPLGRLSVGLGQHYQMVIPQDTFMDAEDGNTRSLILSLYRQSKADLPRSFWLQLNVTSQTIYGIPLAKDYQDHPVELVLSATDSGGSVAMDTVMVSLDAVPLKDFSHVFILTLDMEESAFMASPDILIRLTEKIGKYFGERTPGSVSILSVNKGSVIVSWANSTLSKTECQKDKINQIYSKLSNGNGGVNAKFFSSMLPEFYVSKVTVQHRGICVPFVAESPITTTTTNMSPKKHATEWNEVVLPALIVVFAILLILFVGMICFRRFRHRGKSVLRSEKDEFEEFGQPVVLQEDMELHEINGKPCRPLVMAADLEEPHPGNEWVDERPPPPEYNVPDGKRLSQPLDYDPPVEPGYDNGAYQPPPVYRIPPSYSSPGQSVA